MAASKKKPAAKSQSLSPRPKMNTGHPVPKPGPMHTGHPRPEPGPMRYEASVGSAGGGLTRVRPLPRPTGGAGYMGSPTPRPKNGPTVKAAGKKSGSDRPAGPGISRNPKKQKRGTQTTVPSGKLYGPDASPEALLAKAKKQRSLAGRIKDTRGGFTPLDAEVKMNAYFTNRRATTARIKNKKKLP